MMRLTTLLLLVVCVFQGCRALPKDPPRTDSFAREPAAEGPLATLSKRISAEHGGAATASLPIDRNLEALEYRLMLVDSAVETLDLQYFIWHGDAAGNLMLDRVLRAADRGVRVRLLIDDLVMLGHDKAAKGLDEHPHVEFRLYNPWVQRDGGWLTRAMEGAFDLDRVNHRMHNKLLVADNRVALLGGRNIGNEYFGLNQAYNFRDFDGIVVGAVVAQLSEAFDLYWNSPLAYPADAVPGGIPLETCRVTLAERLAAETEQMVSYPPEPRDWSTTLNELPAAMTVGTARVIVDAPRDLEGTVKPVQVITSLDEVAKDARHEVLISSPYLIPSPEGIDDLGELVKRGVRIRILTNSLLTNDNNVAQQAYGQYRRRMLRAGIELYEMRPDGAHNDVSDVPPVVCDGVALHSKVMVFDRRTVYVGSTNLDPRSMVLNSELGVLIDDPALAERVAQILERDMALENSWTVRLDDNGKAVWVAPDEVLTLCPAKDNFQRMGGKLMGVLIEDQL